MKYHSTYKGSDIFINLELGYKLKWTAYCNGRFVSADTLQGIKRLIREDK
jgi:hypothetical protein